MKNHKQLLADFYLELLAVHPAHPFRLLNQRLYAEVATALAKELHEDKEAVQRIFEKMALEDKQ